LKLVCGFCFRTVHANRVLTPVVDASTCGGMQPGEFTVLRAVCIVPSPLGTIQLKGPCPRGWKTVTRRVNETGTTAAAVLAEVRIATCSHCIRCHLKPLEAHSPCLRCSGGGRRTGRTPLKLNGLLHAGCPPRAGQHGRREDQAFARFRTVDGAAANSQKEEGRRGGAATGWRRSRAAGIAFDSCLAGVGRKAGRRGGRPAVSIGTKLFTFGLSQSPVSEPTGPKSADLSASFAAATSPPAKLLDVCKTAGVVAESLCACLTGRLTAHGHAAAEVGADSDWRCAESTLNRTGAGTWRL
jgi:hypothetical protein